MNTWVKDVAGNWLNLALAKVVFVNDGVVDEVAQSRILVQMDKDNFLLETHSNKEQASSRMNEIMECLRVRK